MHRKHFQFSLRALFILTALAAIWLGYHMNWIRQRHDYQKWLGESHFTFSGQSQSKRGLPWSLRLLGEAPVNTIVLCPPSANQSIEVAEYWDRAGQVSCLFPESEIIELPVLDDEPEPYYSTPSPARWQRITRNKSRATSRSATP